MIKCIIYTFAYNAETTLERTIKSILAQDIESWLWYILDNGSTDKTAEIIKKYADKDNRIIPLANKQNNICEAGNGWWEVIRSYNDSDCLCFLDADDEYNFSFLRKMLCFMKDNDLDLAACGHDFVESKTGQLLDVRCLKKNLILDSPEEYDRYFPVYHQFMRVRWCKLYKVEVLLRFDLENTPLLLGYGGDTRDTAENFRNAGRIGILAESLHTYYINAQSTSYYLDDSRLVCDQVLDDIMRNFLMDKCGFVSAQNDAFLLKVYFNGIKDTINVLLNTKIPTLEKFDSLHKVLTNPHSQRMNAWPEYGDEKTRLYDVIGKWLINQGESYKPAGAETVAKIYFVIYPHLSQIISQEGLAYLLQKKPEIIKELSSENYSKALRLLQQWFKGNNADDVSLTELELNLYQALQKTDEAIFCLLIEIKKERKKSATAVYIDRELGQLMSKYSLLQHISPDLAGLLLPVIRRIMKGDFPRALEKFITISQNLEIPEKDAESYFLLGQNIAAIAKDAGAYIYFKKVWLSYLLDCSRIEEAGKELSEFEALLPEDEDFSALKRRLKLMLEQAED